MSPSYCIKEKKPCVGWVDKYFGDCLCNLRDDFSFGFGLISLVCWGVAEIPQIITNFRTKSSHGVSLAFLLTWVAGDVFNLVGCLLEPATGTAPDWVAPLQPPSVFFLSNWVALLQPPSLITQYYTALLYTTSTVVLVLQSVYYDHIYPWWKCGQINSNQVVEEEKKPLNPKAGDSGIPIPNTPVKAGSTPRDYYYTSARSLAGSTTPPFRSYLRIARSGPSTVGLDIDSSSDDDTTNTHTHVASRKSVSKPKPIPRSAGYGAYLATSINLPRQSIAMMQVSLGFTGRKLLHESGMRNSAFGQWLGWMMAAIYMGGRLPQIWLNIKRGSVEGLNPLMFIFALIANVTYVGSILVRTTEWVKIKANMAWLLDAAVCVMLDLFIILQYLYYKYLRKRISSAEEDLGDYVAADKAVVS